MSARSLLSFLALSTLLASCDQLGIESATATSERKTAEGKAVGGACRHAARAIEDCYTLNPKTEKASIYAGWREMDDYMRENKLEPVKPVLPPPSLNKPKLAKAASAPEGEGGGDATAEGGDKTAAEGEGQGDGKAVALPAKPGHGAKTPSKLADAAGGHKQGSH